MSSRFILVIDDASKEQRDIITKRLDNLKDHGYGYWHWMEAMWLISGAPDKIEPSAISKWLERTPGIEKLTFVVFKVNGPCPYWGRGNDEGWVWMEKNWEGGPM